MTGYPTPWTVGPFGDVWVAADVEFKDGKWHETCPEPRLVVTMAGKDRALADRIVNAVNAVGDVT